MRTKRTVPSIDLIVEVMGCPTICRHCWALGTPYRAMAVGDAAFVLETVHEWCAANGVRFGAFPMHEVAAHPQAASLIRLFSGHDWVRAPFQPFTTTGVPLATRDDWREVLAAATAAGATMAWVAFHGFGSEHDRMVARRGAFEETCLAIERVHSAGLEVGCNVFLTNANAGRFPELAATLSRLEVEQECWLPAASYPHTRSRRYERLRAGLDDLRPFAVEIAARGDWYRKQWTELDHWTEEAWVRRALTGDWPRHRRGDGEEAYLVCRPNLDVHFGRAGLFGERFGNLRADGVEGTMRRALRARGRSLDELWFRPEQLLTPAELAARCGEPEGTALHFDAGSIRYLWLDRASAAGTPR
ncbi:MAG: hypothetical protein M3Z98_04575 [Candidatus Dormibacteraeota bacterium]|nr:hypothetical protein [Candidatus Dormibacteraeota bacterium]